MIFAKRRQQRSVWTLHVSETSEPFPSIALSSGTAVLGTPETGGPPRPGRLQCDGGGVLSSVLMVTFLRFSPFVVSKPFHCIIFIGLSLTIVSNPSLRVFFKIYLHT